MMGDLILPRLPTVTWLLAWHICTVSVLAWQPSNLSNPRVQPRNVASHQDAPLSGDDHMFLEDCVPTRRSFLSSACLMGGCLFGVSTPASALVKGNAPPPKQSPTSDRPKCTNMDECQALAERKAEEERAAALAEAVPTSVTKAGTRYRDLETGQGAVAQKGDEVKLYYKVLKLGKRSYDGLSGEGTVVFSRGYGLEDDEKEPGSTSFTTIVGSYGNIAALNDAVVGMKENGVRRFAVLPQAGWRKPGGACDGGPGGSGKGGDLKTDFVVVPTATMVAEEACFDSTKLPFPASYAQQRRMAQRFDQSLIMEVTLVSAKPATDGF